MKFHRNDGGAMRRALQRAASGAYAIAAIYLASWLAAPVAVAGCVNTRCAYPTVAISQPANNLTLRTTGTVNVTVTGRATGDVVTTTGGPYTFPIRNVGVYLDGTLLGNATITANGQDPDLERPYSDYTYTFTGVSPGTHALGVKATDDARTGVTSSALVTVTVNVVAMQAPNVSITAPANGTVSTIPGSFGFTSSASDPDGTVSSVQYFANGAPISNAIAASPYAFSWSGMSAGSYSIVARATDNEGLSRDSTAVAVVANDRPTIALSTANANGVAPGSITLQASAADGVGGVSNVTYYANGSAISGALGVAPYTLNWTNVGRGTYSIVARATDAYGSTTDASAFSWVVNQAPSVALTTPASGTVSTAPSNFNLTATASDADGSIASVQYFANGTAISGALTAPPYAFTWSGMGPGSYGIVARATDNGGLSQNSASATVIANDRPTVSLSTTDANGLAPGSIALQATAGDNVGGVSNVTYLANGTAISSALTAPPFAFNWSGVGRGSYSIVARVTDAYGAFTDSTAFSWVVNQPPTVSLTSPASGAVITNGLPATVNLVAQASDVDGSIAKVEFRVDGALAGSATSAPFSLTWSTNATGAHSVQARAFDNGGATLDSPAVSFIVDAPPVVAMAAPMSGATYQPGWDIPLSATASDTDGSISKLELLDGASVIATLTSGPPYNFLWHNVAAGTHAVTARATDNQGAVKTSAAININVAFVAPLPSNGTGLPGTTAGALTVNAIGVAQYNIPIAVPPGTAGMVPAVSLQYDSAGGNGAIGVGWSLSGLGAIIRCPRTQAQDGVRAGVLLTLDDRFCMDGQRLNLLGGGAYGAPSSEYRTEVDSFVKVVAVGTSGNGPASFKTWRRDGTVMEYGATADARMILAGHATPLQWALNKVTDARGNYYTVTYTFDAATGQLYPSRIDYTGNATAGTPITPYNSVRFEYDFSRPDAELRYVLGAKVIGAARLTHVKTYAESALVKDYQLTYSIGTATGRSRIRDVTECAGNGVCLPSTTFTWNDSLAGFVGSTVDLPSDGQQWGGLLTGDMKRDYWVDVTGDGRPDHCVLTANVPQSTEDPTIFDILCALTQPGGAAPLALKVGSLLGAEVFFVDVNGDGVQDICGQSLCFAMKADGVLATMQVPSWATRVGSRNQYSDVNGDGLADHCAITYGFQTPYWAQCSLSTGTGFASAVVLGDMPSSLKSVDWVDITGDGILSLCYVDLTGAHCRQWGPSGFAAEKATGAVPIGDAIGKGLAWVDVNGDGLADFCRVVSATDNVDDTPGSLLCTLSTGVGFGDTVAVTNLQVGYARSAAIDTSRMWPDVNGDGKADFCRVRGWVTGTPSANAYLECTLSTGSGFGATFQAPVGAWDRHGSVVDATGDGNADLCYRTDTGSASTPHCISGSSKYPDKLAGVVNGLGASASVEYRPISDPSIYTKGSGATFPVLDIQDNTPAVQRVLTSDGVGGMHEEHYAYEGSRVDLSGRGFLGYAAATVTSPAGLRTRSTRYQAFPLTGLQQGVKFIGESGTVLSETAYTYDTNLQGPVAKVQSATTIEKTNDLNGAFKNWVETTASAYDPTCGNAQQVTTVYKTSSGAPDGFSNTMSVGYQNDIGNWILCQPVTVSVSATAPNAPGSTRTTANSYYANGLLRQRIVEPNNGGGAQANLRLATDFTYDDYGNLKTRSVSGAQIATRTEVTLAYDLRGRLPLTVDNALGHRETRTFDWQLGTMLTLESPNLLQTTLTYDPFGRLLTATRADGTRETLTYQPCAGCAGTSAFVVKRTEAVVASGAVVTPPSRIYYDTLSRPVLRVESGFDGQEIYRETLFDNLGRVAYEAANYRIGDPLIRWTQYSHDLLGRVVLAQLPDETTVTYGYDGRSRTTTNVRGVVTRETVDSQGRLSTVVNAEGSVDASAVVYAYDAWGNLAKSTDAKGNEIVTEYDLRGRKIALNDPDLGRWAYVVDNLGQVTHLTDAKGQGTDYVYDRLGRMTERREPDLTSRWFFETTQAGLDCNKAKGKLCEATSDNGYWRRNAYDNLGRLTTQTHHVDADYMVRWSYDEAGRPQGLTYPLSTGALPLSLQYNYTPLGFLASVSSGATIYWTRNAANADGNVVSESYGNGLSSARSHEPLTGRLSTVQSGTASNPAGTQNQAYNYDNLGRLQRRRDLVTGTDEVFGYDNLNRLTTEQLVAAGAPMGGEVKSVTYDSIGNVTSKQGVGSYSYNASGAGSVRPHAVAGVTGTVNGMATPSFGYDANGNMLAGAGRSIAWTSFNMPLTLANGSGVSSFLYGSEHQRVQQTWTEGGSTLRTVYLDSPQFEKEVSSQSGLTEYKHYVNVDGRTVAIHTRRSNGSEDVKYLLVDHLGSISVVTDVTGMPTERLAYDPWGDRRTASGSTVGAADPLNAIQPVSTDRGYTGHEHLDRGSIGLVHMNGRVYDPVLVRFISADPFVSHPGHSQSYNRYSYVGNDPLNFIDPSGYEDEPARLPRVAVKGNKPSCADNPSCVNAFKELAAMGLIALRNFAVSPQGRALLNGSRILVGLTPQGRLVLLAITAGYAIYENREALAEMMSNVVGGSGASGDKLPKADEAADAAPSSPTGANSTSPQTPPPDDEGNRRNETDHSKQRADEAKTDANRNVGDRNAVIRDGKQYTDDLSGNKVYVSGDRVVITDQEGNYITQFKNSRANTNARVESGRWIPVPPPGF